jgi:hypothetical protein
MQFQVARIIRFMGTLRHSLRAHRKACRDGAIIRNRLSLTHRQLSRQEFLQGRSKTNLQTQTRLMHGPVAELLLSSSRRCGQLGNPQGVRFPVVTRFWQFSGSDFSRVLGALRFLRARSICCAFGFFSSTHV